MTANVDSKVDRSCNNWACCLWCCGKPDDVIEVRPAPPPPTPAPAALVRTVAIRTLKDVGSLSGETQIQFDAVHLSVHHTPTLTPQVTPEQSMQEE